MPPRSIESAFPLTPLQEGMLYHTLREPDAGVYHAHCTATLVGDLEEEHFFVTVRKEYWTAPEGSPIRALAEQLIGKLEF